MADCKFIVTDKTAVDPSFHLANTLPPGEAFAQLSAVLAEAEEAGYKDSIRWYVVPFSVYYSFLADLKRAGARPLGEAEDGSKTVLFGGIPVFAADYVFGVHAHLTHGAMLHRLPPAEEEAEESTSDEATGEEEGT